ncbi:MAG TPA: hypothetical protein VGO93_22605 [Candidatus Xenobia bacterium]
MILNLDWVVSVVASLLACLLIVGGFARGADWQHSEQLLEEGRQRAAARGRDFDAVSATANALPDLARAEQEAGDRWAAATHGHVVDSTSVDDLTDRFNAAVGHAVRQAGLKQVRTTLFIEHATDVPVTSFGQAFREYQVVLTGSDAGVQAFAHTVATCGLGVVAEVRSLHWDPAQESSTWVIRVFPVTLPAGPSHEQ